MKIDFYILCLIFIITEYEINQERPEEYLILFCIFRNSGLTKKGRIKILWNFTLENIERQQFGAKAVRILFKQGM